MTILHVRNVPERLYTRRQRRAEAQRRSLSAKVIALLEWAVEEVERAPTTTWSQVRQRRFFKPAQAGAPDSTRLLRQNQER